MEKIVLLNFIKGSQRKKCFIEDKKQTKYSE